MKPWAKKTVFIVISTLLNVFFTFLCVILAVKTKIWMYAIPALFLVYCFALIFAERRVKKLGMKGALAVAFVFCLPMVLSAAAAITAVVLNETGAADIFGVFLCYIGALISFALSAAAAVFRALFALGECLTSLIFKGSRNRREKEEKQKQDDNNEDELKERNEKKDSY